MIKMYQQRSHTGSSPEFWEENWEVGKFEEAVRFCAMDPLRPLFEKYMTPGGLMLEGGCGMGHYLTFYAALGYRVIGLDFALQALKQLASRKDSLDLVGGDVSRLPFADESFDLYYSGGVVEHFEGGPEAALQEARRVLRPDGILLLSVPYHSLLRDALHPFKKDHWRKLTTEGFDNDKDAKALGDKNFFQYAYRRKEFEKKLSHAGLSVVETQGYSVLWGLYEIPFLNPGGKNEFCGNATTQESTAIVPLDWAQITIRPKTTLLKRIILSEDDSILMARPFIKLGRWAAANMMMYVCVRK